MNAQETYSEPGRKIPVHGSYDVIVVGGGCAGLAAATAAARNGAAALIIERFPFFGGAATASLMTNINGFRNQVEPDGLQTSRGIAEEVILTLKELGGLGRSGYKQKEYPTTKGQLSFSYAVDPELFKYATLKMVVDAGARILFHTWFCDAIMDGRRVVGVVFENKSGRQAAYAKVVVDASGDADVAARAGAGFWQTKGEEASRLVDCLMYRVIGFPQGHSIHGCEANGVLTLWGPSPGAGNGADGDELTAEEIRTRLAVYEDLERKKRENPQLREARLIETGPLIGVRQTRFVDGLYKITVDDVLAGRRFDDAIAMASKPIIHFFGYRRYLEHEGYDIPYRALLPRDVDGVILAGRCISSDQPAFESWRSMGPSMCVGEAAGTAAAMCAREGIEPKTIDVRRLRGQLIAQGAEVNQNRRHGELPSCGQRGGDR